jgi:hypothetical protein
VGLPDILLVRPLTQARYRPWRRQRLVLRERFSGPPPICLAEAGAGETLRAADEPSRNGLGGSGGRATTARIAQPAQRASSETARSVRYTTDGWERTVLSSAVHRGSDFATCFPGMGASDWGPRPSQENTTTPRCGARDAAREVHLTMIGSVRSRLVAGGSGSARSAQHRHSSATCDVRQEAAGSMSDFIASNAAILALKNIARLPSFDSRCPG